LPVNHHPPLKQPISTGKNAFPNSAQPKSHIINIHPTQNARMSTADPPKRTSTTASSAARPPSKRLSTISAPPKPPAKIDPTVIIANHALLTGSYPITIGAHSVIHPYAKIISTNGPVTIGDGCIIWEKGVVGGAGPVSLGKNVVVETCAAVEGGTLGDGCCIEAFGKVGADAVLGRGCRVMTFVEVGEGEEVEEHMILYGKGLKRRDRAVVLEGGVVEGIRESSHGKQIKALEGLVPSNLAKWV
jgi:dynactin-6